jgi:hypothetical protein
MLRPVTARASLIADSSASLPLFTSSALPRSREGGSRLRSVSAIYT